MTGVSGHSTLLDETLANGPELAGTMHQATLDNRPSLFEQLSVGGGPSRPDAQETSPFFARLPAEIRRQVYQEVWRTQSVADDQEDKDQAATVLRIVPANHSLYNGEPVVHFVTEVPAASRVDRDREARFGEPSRKNDENEMRSCKSPDRPIRPFLPLLLTCRRMYTEALPSLYGDTTFQIRHLATAQAFLQHRWPCVLARLDLHMAIQLFVAGLYRRSRGGGRRGARIAMFSVHTSRPPTNNGKNGTVDRTHNDWERLSRVLVGCAEDVDAGSESEPESDSESEPSKSAAHAGNHGLPPRLPRVKHLTLTVGYTADSADAARQAEAGWHMQTVEKNLFATLLKGWRRAAAAADATTTTTGSSTTSNNLPQPPIVTLSLPWLPVRSHRSHPPHTYLENGPDMPFTIVRRPGPNSLQLVG